MKPELKLGRKVIAWNNSGPEEYKGEFISQDIHGDNWVLEDGDDSPRCFDNVKTDLTAEPMNGDEVKWKHYSGKWVHGTAEYIGQNSDGIHVVEYQCGNVLNCTDVRFPQSKRDRIKEAIRSWQESSTVPLYDDLADQILKITEEQS